MIRKLFIATAFVAVTCLAAAPVSAQLSAGNSSNYLFSQYATPNGPNMTTAGMYPAPYYSPQLGAQSNYTYQPLMPHEMMYRHARNYFNYYNTNGSTNNPYGCTDSVTKTQVRWMSGAHHIAPLHHGRLGIGYRIHSHMYGLCRGDGCGSDDCGGDCDGGRRHRLHGHRARGGLGCHNGKCGTGDVYDATYGAGCATGCTASFGDGLIQR